MHDLKHAKLTGPAADVIALQKLIRLYREDSANVGGKFGHFTAHFDRGPYAQRYRSE